MMGDRGSIGIKDSSDETYPVLFCHWGGSKESMKALCQKTKEEFIAERKFGPFDQAGEILARMTKIAVEHGGHSAYLALDEHSGDNSDNGHYMLDVSNKTWVLKKDGKELMRL
jgi:hypothetical protein